MAGNTVAIEFAGDAKKLQAAGKDAVGTNERVGKSATSAADDFNAAGKSTDQYVDRVGKLGAGVEGMSGAFDSAGAAVQSLVDIQNAGRERAARLARAQADVEQAMLDGKQAAIDLRQAQNDLTQSSVDLEQAQLDLTQSDQDVEQAKLDAVTAQKDYNAAVAEFGAGSDEARQAALDLSQAEQDRNQALLDAKQAQADVTQAQIDASQATNDAAQATREGKDAQLDLNDAMAEANPSGLAKFAENINMITPLLSGMVGVVGLVTAAQWAWNAAQLASPTTWIILAIVALIAVIVLIATKTTWFQTAWRVAWGGIKDAAAAVGRFFADTVWGKWIKGAWNGIQSGAQRVWNYLKAMPGSLKVVFSRIADFLFQPFRTAFNLIATAWNRTIGSLSWSVPGWIPGIGGNTISVPNLPKFHSGGVVGGAPGQEVLAVLQAGETVIPAGRGVGGGERWIPVDMGVLGDALLAAIAESVRSRGGRVTALGVSVVGGQVRT